MSNLVIDALQAVGVASATLVNIELTDSRGNPIVGYLAGSDQVIVLPTTVTTDENGQVTVDIVPTADIVPGNSCYTIRVAEKQFLIQKSGATQTLFEALVANPGDLDPISNDFLLRANNLSDLDDLAMARNNLELGNSATLNVGTIAGTVAAGDDARFQIAPDHIADTIDAHDATAISFAPTISIPADDVQEAIEFVMDAAGTATNDHNTLINRDAADQHPASSVTNTPAGTIAATHVQGAINELDGDIQGHVADTVDAHDASAISVVPFATISATEVQTALQQVYASAVTGLDEASEISFVPTGDIAATNVQTAIVEVDGELHAHEALATDAHDASAISFVPAGGISSINAQAAIEEALTDSVSYTNAHISNPIDAHDASAISFVPTGTIAATDVQAAIAEVATDTAAGFVPINGSYAAASTDAIRTRVTGNANPRFTVNADGTLEWGDGTAALDTNLYRSLRNGTSVLTTDDRFRVSVSQTDPATMPVNVLESITTFTAASSAALNAVSLSSYFNTGTFAHSGEQKGFYGFSGTLAGSGSLATLHSAEFGAQIVSGTTITALNHLTAETPQGPGTVTTGTGFYSQNMGRSGTVTSYGLRIDPQSGSGTASYGAAIGASTTQTLWISNNANNTTAAAGIAFGSSRDTNLYRSAADTLKTDDSFVVGTNLTVTGTTLYSDNVTMADAKNIILNATTGTKIGTATTEKLGFHNATPVIQRAGAAQVAVATTASTNVTPFGFTTAAQADSIVTLLNEIRATLVEKGLMKGAA